MEGSFLDGSAALGGGLFATDASGGEHTKDPRLRRCIWAAVHYAWHPDADSEGHLEVLGTMSGPLPGEQQAVARAELFAVVALLEHSSAAATVWTDCQSIWRRWSKGPQRAAKSRMPGVWRRFWDLLADRELDEHAGDRRLEWCPSHRTLEEVHQGVLSHEAWAANNAADEAANAAADRHRLPDHVVKAVEAMDAKIEMVQDRLMAINH